MNYSKTHCRTYYVQHLRTPHSEATVRGYIFNKVASLKAWRPLAVLERESSTGFFSVNFVKFLEKKDFCRTPPSSHFSHVFFFAFCRSVRLAVSNQVKWWSNGKLWETILYSYRNQVETLLSCCGHICTDLDIPIDGELEDKEELKNLLKWGEFSFNVMVDHEINLKNKN